jgi:hypothetical protein
MSEEMVQLEIHKAANRGGFVVTLSPVRSRWIRYGGTCGNKRCTTCGGFFETGEFYYSSAVHGPFCEQHAAATFNARRDDG